MSFRQDEFRWLGKFSINIPNLAPCWNYNFYYFQTLVYALLPLSRYEDTRRKSADDLNLVESTKINWVLIFVVGLLRFIWSLYMIIMIWVIVISFFSLNKSLKEKIPIALNFFCRNKLKIVAINTYWSEKISLSTIAINSVAIGYHNKIFIAIVFCCNKLVAIKRFYYY